MKIYRFLQDLVLTSQNLEKHFEANKNTIAIFNQAPIADGNEREKMRSMLSEVDRDGKILKRKLSFILDETCSANLNDNVTKNLSDAFTCLLQDTKQYNNKWNNYYQNINVSLSSTLC